MCHPVWILWHGRRMLSSTAGTSVYAFPLFCHTRQVTSRVMASWRLHDPGSSALATKGVVHRSSGFSGGRTSLTPMPLILLMQYHHVRKFHRGLELLCLHLWKLSNYLSPRQAFLRRSQSLLL